MVLQVSDLAWVLLIIVSYQNAHLPFFYGLEMPAIERATRYTPLTLLLFFSLHFLTPNVRADVLSYSISGTLGDGDASIEITSDATPSWRAVWDEDAGGTISAFYTPSTSSTNLVNTDAEWGALLQAGIDSGGWRMQREYADAAIVLYEVTPTRIVLRVDGSLESGTYGSIRQSYHVYPNKIVLYSTVTPSVNTSTLLFNLSTFDTTAIADNHFQFDLNTLESANTLVTGWTSNPANIDYEQGSSLQCIVSGSTDTDFSIWTEDSDPQFATEDEYGELDGGAPGRGIALPATNSGSFSQGNNYTSIAVLTITDDNTSDGSEAQGYAQDFWMPDVLSFTSGSEWAEDGDGFNQREAVYTIDMGSTQILTFDIDGDTYTRSRPTFKVRGWRSLSEPDNVTVETTELVNGTDYNADVKPFTDAQFGTTTPDIIIDDDDGSPTYTENGSWSDGTDANAYGGNFRYDPSWLNEDKYATFTPNIQVAGNYNVFEWHPSSSQAPDAAPHVIVYNGGTATVNVNQEANGGQWNLLGTYNFSTGTSGYVRILDDDWFEFDGAYVRSDAMRFEYAGSSYTQLAAAGDTTNSNEYLASNTNDYTLDFGAGDYFYLGSEVRFAGVNIDLQQAGAGDAVMTWEYWNGSAWSALTVSETVAGADDFKASGCVYFTPPGGWQQTSVNSGPSLYYIRVSVSSGSFTTYPIENIIKTDILLFQYLGPITEAAQTFDFAGPTAVTLKGFAAEPGDDHVLLRWTTAHEIDNAGFHLHRSLSREGPYTRINPSLIPGQGYSVRGARYWYLDEDVEIGVTYYYKLEDVDFHGHGTFHGPVWATPGGDRDGDGMPDWWEEEAGLDPTIDDSMLDYDGDGLSNGEEFLHGFDPLNPDTDGDGVPDGLETGSGGTDGDNGGKGGDGVRITDADDSGVTVELVTSSFYTETQVVDGVEYQRISIPSYSHGFSSEVGFPRVPVKGILLEVPEKCGLSVELLESEEETYAGYLPYPVPLHRAQAGEGGSRYLGERFRLDRDAYSINRFYPGTPAQLGDAGYLRDQRVVQLRFYPIQFNPPTGALKLYKRIRVRVSFQDRALAQLFSPTQITAALPPFDGTTYKLSINETGMYRLGYDYLATNAPELLSEPSWTIKLYNKGQEVALRVVGGDFIEFYGVAEDTRYTDVNVYWLTAGGSGGKRMEEIQIDVPSPMRPDSFWHVAHFERNEDYWGDIPGDEHIDRWFHQDYIGGGHPYERQYTLNLNGVIDTADSATMKVFLFGMADLEPHPNHHTRISINGHLVHDAFWDGQREYLVEVEFPQAYLREGENIVEVEALLDTGAEWDWILCNWFEAGYRRSLDAAGDDELEFTISIAGEYEVHVDGFSGNSIEVFDITDPLTPKRFRGLGVTGDGPYSVAFEDSVDAHKTYLALTVEKMKGEPAAIERFESRNLRSPSNSADWIAITHEDFFDEVQPLAQYRQEHGLRAMVVTTTQVYDEFNGGIPSPHAIKDFLRYAYEHWQPPAPGYLLLVGDGTYDYRDYHGQAFGNFLPVYLTYTQCAGEVPSDNWYGCVHGEDYISDLHVGRLPARTSQDVRAMVDKILAYESSPVSQEGWERRIMLVADNDEPGFEGLNEACASSLSPAYLISRKYLRKYGGPSVLKQQLIDEINGGTLLINYVGHGAEDFWADEGIFEAGDVDELHNGDDGPRYPLVVAMTCLNGYFIEAFEGWDSLAEVLMKPAHRGAVAVFTSAGMTTPGEQALLDRGIFEAIFIRGENRLGEAVDHGKRSLLASSEGAREAVGTFLLFGDPATEVKVQASPSSTPAPVSSGGGCFIATAAYGSSAEEHVVTLRRFRDQYLLSHGLGNHLVRLYERLSPGLATSIKERDSLRTLARMTLWPLVGMSTLYSWVDLPKRWPLVITIAVITSVLLYMEFLIRRYRKPREAFKHYPSNK